jgi:DNA-binding CsgD family transcriptional regulator
VAVPWQACSSRLVGRETELAHLVDRLEQMVAVGTGGMALVLGEAGVGKSRLIAETVAAATAAGVSVFTGRAVPGGEPYRALVEALTVALRGRSLPRDDSLRPYLPALAAVLPDARIEGRIDPPGGVALGEGVRRLVAALAGLHGAVLVLEDLQWADPDSLDVLTYLAHAGDASPLLLLVTARDEDGALEPLLRLGASCQAPTVTLSRLDPAATRAVVESCLTGPPPQELVDFVSEHADGLPLLVEELLTGLAAAGTLQPDGDLTGPLTTNVPRTFAATIRQRLSSLSRPARSVIRTAAILGRRFDYRLLAEIAGLPETVVLEALRAARDSGLLEVEDSANFRFRHALTCEAVVDDMLPPEQESVARAAAAVVERRDPQASELAAALWCLAGEETRAAELYARAGEQAHRRGALRSAERLLTRSAQLPLADRTLRAQVDHALLDVLAAIGETDRALELGRRLLAEGETRVRLTLAEVAADAGRWDAAAAELAALPPDADPRVRVLGARVAHSDGRPEDARRLACEALQEAQERGLWSVACAALEVVGRAARLSDLTAARDAFRAAYELAVLHDLPVERLSALHEMGTVDLLLDGSVDLLEQARELASDAGLLAEVATVDVQIAAALLHRDTVQSLAHAQRSANLASRLGMNRLRATALFFEAAAHADRRDIAAVERCVAEAEALAPEDLDVNAGIWGAVRAHIALLDDDRSTLASCLDRAVDFLRRSPTTTPAPTRGLWALVRTIDDRDGEQAREEARASSVNWENRALLGYAEAVDAGRRRQVAEADRLLGEADAALAALPWWRHRVRLLVAEEALSRGWGDPLRWAREAVPFFSRRGDERLARRCRQLLRGAGVPVPREGRGDTPVPAKLRARGVTSREMDVLVLVGQGLSNRDIAQKLVLSPRTVETHVAKLISKTGVAGRAELADLLRRLTPGL